MGREIGVIGVEWAVLWHASEGSDRDAKDVTAAHEAIMGGGDEYEVEGGKIIIAAHA